MEYIKIQLNKCNGERCKSEEEIEKYFEGMQLTIFMKEKIINPYNKEEPMKEREKPMVRVDLQQSYGSTIDINLHKTNYKLNDTEEFTIWRPIKGE